MNMDMESTFVHYFMNFTLTNIFPLIKQHWNVTLMFGDSFNYPLVISCSRFRIFIIDIQVDVCLSINLVLCCFSFYNSNHSMFLSWTVLITLLLFSWCCCCCFFFRCSRVLNYRKMLCLSYLGHAKTFMSVQSE